ncbi:MAG: hypothetical protein AMXMBFR84_48170 [Candidatus Hydrogenedentota bacterium]
MGRAATVDLLPLLGTGKAHPHVLSLATGELVFSDEPGASIYAMALSLDHSRVAVATRSGRIHAYTANANTLETAGWVQHRAGIISVCFLEDDQLAASDEENNLLIMQAQCSQPDVISIPHPGGAVTGLHYLEGCLIGITDQGVVYVMQTSTRQFTTYLAASPPSPLGWVKGAYWEEAKSVVFPAKDGGMSILNLPGKTMSQVSAHLGDFYALVPFGTRLLSFGHDDGKALEWCASPITVRNEMEIPKGVVGAARSASDELVLVFREGFAQRFQLRNCILRPSGEPLEGDYRSCLGIDEVMCNELRLKAERKRIDRIIEEVGLSVSEGRTGDLTPLFEELQAAGREDVVMAAEAERSRLEGDLVGELRHYARLVPTLPDAPGSVPCLSRMIERLLYFGFADLAQYVFQRVEAILGARKDALRHSMLLRVLREKDREVHVLFRPAENPRTRDIVRAANALGVPLSHAVVIGRSEPFPYHDCRILPEQFAERFEETHGLISRVSIVRTSIFHDDELSAPESMILLSSLEPSLQRIRFALRFEYMAESTLVEALPLLWPTPDCSKAGPNVSNDRCLRCLDELVQSGPARIWVDTTSKYAMETLRALANIEINRRWKVSAAVGARDERHEVRSVATS